MNSLEFAEISLCRKSLFEFTQSFYREYEFIWYHELIANKVQDVIEGKIKKLMLFVPPQHQKSTIASRCAPAWGLGYNPNFRIIHAAYGVDLVEGFSRDIQRIIDNEFYSNVFPETKLNESGKNKTYVRTVEKWDIINKKGSYFCAGVTGGITGKPCDIGIIDDPIKGAQDASSETIRNRVWEWYLQDFRTRLHNDSRQIIIQTRWHSDDLAGRILEVENDWEVITLPAIKEDYSNKEDKREIGEALYPGMHSLERLEEIKKLSPKNFAALYQQNPVIEGGNIIRLEWFKYTDKKPVLNIDFWIDTAYTEKTKDDPSGIIATGFDGRYMYVINAKKVRFEFPELVNFIINWTKENGYTFSSKIHIEPKASGLSVIQQLTKETKLNIVRTKTPKEDKTTRLTVASPSIETGKVILINGTWNTEFIDEICGFPAKKHDEYVDLISYAIDYYFNLNQNKVVIL